MQPRALSDGPAVLVVQHGEDGPAARLGRWLVEGGARLTTVHPYAGEQLPAGLDGHHALVVLGGSQQAFPDPVTGAWSAPWLPATLGLLREAVGTTAPALGICLGGQLLAQAHGGRVAPGAAGPEIGAGLVAKRDGSATDALFGPLPLTPDVVQWHDDAIDQLPPGAVLLASSARYPHQAYRVGECAWGLQFHVEVDEPMVRQWAAGDRERLAGLDLSADRVADAVVARLDDLEQTWRPVAQRFVALAAARARR